MVNIKIKAITPIHIGSGNSYDSSQFLPIKIKEKNFIKRVNVSDFYLDLSDDEKDEFIRNLSSGRYCLEDEHPHISKKYTSYISYNFCKNEIRSNNDILENIKTLNKLYIPGSSIKGSIKTALLYNSVSLDDIPNIIDEIMYINRKNEERIGRDDNFINKILSSRTFKNKSQGSIMRFLQISDSSLCKTSAIYDIKSLMVRNKNSFDDSKNLSYFKKSTNRFLECIPTGSNLTTSIKTNYDKKTYSILNLQDKEKFNDIEYIKESICRFSNALINHELKFSKKYNINFLYDFYQRLKDKNDINAPFLRIGEGSGFIATTLGLMIKEYDDKEFDTYMDRIADATQGTNYYYEYPKSRKITLKGHKPLGWVQLNFMGDD